MASKDHPKRLDTGPDGAGADVAQVDMGWPTAPDYRKMAQELAQLGAEAARRARMTGNGHYDRLARTLTNRAGEILDDLKRSGKA